MTVQFRSKVWGKSWKICLIFLFFVFYRTWRCRHRLISCLERGGSPFFIFLRKTYKARSLAASPGLCPGLLAASNHLARSTHGFRRLVKIMRNLPEEQSRGISSYTKRVNAVTKGIVLIFILGKLITKGRSGPSFVQVIRKMNEVLPFDWFFFLIHPEKVKILLRLFIHWWQALQWGFY